VGLGSKRKGDYKMHRGQKKTIDVYDARGREKHHSWRTREDQVDPSTPDVSRVWDDANRLMRIENSFSIIEYSYDEAGQVQTESTTVAGSAGTNVVRYCRYPNGEVSKVTYPNGSTAVNRHYTARGQLQSEDWAGGRVDYAYLKDGKVDYEDYGNGVRSDLDYDGRGMISLTSTYRPSTGRIYAKRDYWRDDRDRILGFKKGSDTWANPRENGRGDRYEYDFEGQLTRASYEVDDPSGNATGALRGDWFHYDAMGNRVGWNDVASRGSMWFDRRENKLNQYQSWYNNYPSGPLHWGSAIYHDDDFPMLSSPWIPPGNGVTMADGWIVASYNALNQPVAIGCTGYGNKYMWLWYDPLGRCVKRWMGEASQEPVGTNPITYFYYDGWNLIQEGTAATAADRVYVHGNRVDEIVASWATGGNWLYHHYDARGNCILQTNASGGLQEQYEYDAFGWPYFYTATGAPARVNGKPGSPSGNRFLFTGREFLSGLRIYDYRNRIYQPELGRFLQPDPEEFEAGDYNLYRYCHNDPVNKSDPMGLEQLTASIWNDLMRFQSGSLLSSNQFDAVRQGKARVEWSIEKEGRGRAASESHGNGGQSGGASEQLNSGLENSAIYNASQLPLDLNRRSSHLKNGEVFVSHYGYPRDKYFDRNSNILRKGNHGNKLTNQSLALTSKFAKSYGIKVGDPVHINGRFLGNYDDTAPQSHQYRIDAYDRYGQKSQNWGGVLSPPFTVGTIPYE